jgi:hypothetical protein
MAFRELILKQRAAIGIRRQWLRFEPKNGNEKRLFLVAQPPEGSADIRFAASHLYACRNKMRRSLLGTRLWFFV